ncbi:LamG-like jellyroll fold domain-containing protein [Halosimplex aquaticum]
MIGGVTGVLALRALGPDYWANLISGVNRITASQTIAETQSLLSGDSFGWLLLFGFLLALAFPFLVWESIEIYRGKRSRLVPVVYTWYFLLIAMYQVRFAGQLAMFASVFSGLGFVYLAATIELIEKPVPFADHPEELRSFSLPSTRVLGQLAVLFLLISGLSIVQVPIKTNQVVTDGQKYQTAAWMEEYASEQGWEYPENYVFSRWGDNRMYNYFVSGESNSYSYAQTHYDSFLTSSNVTQWYGRLNGQAGFIVMTPSVPTNRGTISNHLYEHYGGTGTSLESTGQFRAVYQTADGSYKVYTPVTGALIAGQTSVNRSNVVDARVDIPQSSFVYERRITGAENGWYMLRVPYSTTYNLPGNASVTVSNPEIRNGSIANVRHSNGTWPLSAGRGEFIFDQTGDNHGYLINGKWVNSSEWAGLSFNGSGYARIPNGKSIDGSEGFTLTTRFRTDPNVDYKNDLRFPRIVSKASSGAYRNTDGYQIALSRGHLIGVVGNGTSAEIVRGGEVSDSHWYNVTLTWDGSLVRFYVNGKLVDSGSFTGSPENDSPLVFGASGDLNRQFSGLITQVMYRNSSIDPNR